MVVEAWGNHRVSLRPTDHEYGRPRACVCECDAYPRRRLRKFQPPAGALGERLARPRRCRGRRRSGCWRSRATWTQLGLALDEVAAGQVRVAGQDLRMGYRRRAGSGLPRTPSTTGTTTWPPGRFLNAPISSVRSPAPIIGWSARATNTASNGAAQRREADPHRALLPLAHTSGCGRASPGSPAPGASTASRACPVTTTTSSTPAAAERDQMAADQGHALQADQRLGHAAHAPALARREQAPPRCAGARRARRPACTGIPWCPVSSRTQSLDWP